MTECRKCKASWIPPVNVNVKNCPFCNTLIKVTYGADTAEGRVQTIVSKHTIEIYNDKVKFSELVTEFFPNKFGELLKILIDNNVSIYAYKCKDAPISQKDDNFISILKRASNDTTIVEDVLCPPLYLLFIGLDIDCSNMVLDSRKKSPPSDIDDFDIYDGVLARYNGSKTVVTIPNTVTRISDNAFVNKRKITEIIIPETVEAIGYVAFSGCESLTKIVLPKKLRKIESYLFKNCISLKTIDIPENVTIIELCAFSGCENLVHVTLPNSIKKIGSCAFDDCFSLDDETKARLQQLGYRLK